MDKKIIIAEAQELANRMAPDEIRGTIQDREPTEVEHLAILLSKHRELDERIAGEKAERAKQKRKESIDKTVAEVCHDLAKEKFRKEKLRHQLVEESFKEEKAKHKAEKARHLLAEAGFVEEKANHKAERERHAQAVARFQRDIEPLREIKRAEKEAERIDNVEGCRAGSGRISELRVPPRDVRSEGHPTTPLPV